MTETHTPNELEQTCKRELDRRRILKGGIMASHDKFTSFSCTIRDISDTGAKLKVDPLAALPETFILMIDLDGIEVDCQMVWRDGNHMGVKFTSEMRQKEPKRAQSLQPTVAKQKPTLRRRPLEQS